MKLYGIPNCDTVKKARKHFAEQGVTYDFIDIKTTEVSTQQLQHWLSILPDTVVNKRSTTYRENKQEWLSCKNQNEQIVFLQRNPTIIKRPVIEHDDGSVTVGWPIKK